MMIDWRAALRLAARHGQRQFINALQAAIEHERAEFRHELAKDKTQFEAEMAALHRELAAVRAEGGEALQQLQAGLNELQAAYEDKLRFLVAENDRLQQENNKLRADCAELHEARGLLDFIKTQRDLDQPPDPGIQRSAD